MADMLVRYFDNGCNVLIVKAVKHMLAAVSYTHLSKRGIHSIIRANIPQTTIGTPFLPPRENSQANSFFTVSVVIIAFAADSEPVSYTHLKGQPINIAKKGLSLR